MYKCHHTASLKPFVASKPALSHITISYFYRKTTTFFNDVMNVTLEVKKLPILALAIYGLNFLWCHINYKIHMLWKRQHLSARYGFHYS